MQELAGERITLAWWNTSLSPLGKERPQSSDFSIVQVMLDHLLADRGVHFCALGEVSETDVQRVEEHLKGSHFNVTSGVQSIGRSSFSTCFVVDQRKLNFQLGTFEVVSVESSRYRLAQQVYLATTDQSTLFHLLISHWPSRLRVQAGAPIRSTLGNRLRQIVDSILASDETAKIVLMGDYNDEPFDDSLSHHLRATRDRDLIMKKPSLLYNPFWRQFCHPQLALGAPPVDMESWGTYFYKNDSLFNWRTFDQMMFSSSFLGLGDWRLNEASTTVIDFQPYTRLVIDRDATFDHLPIVASLERNQNGRL